MTDLHSQSTLCAVDAAMCLMFPVQMSKIIPDAITVVSPLTNQLLCGKQRVCIENQNDTFKKPWLVFSFNSVSRAYPSKH